MTTEKTDRISTFLKWIQVIAFIVLIPTVGFFLSRFIGSVDALTETVNILKTEVSTGRIQQMDKLNWIEVTVNKSVDRQDDFDARMNSFDVDLEVLKRVKKH